MYGGVKYIIDDVDGLPQTARVQFGYPFAKIPVIYEGKKRLLVGVVERIETVAVTPLYPTRVGRVLITSIQICFSQWMTFEEFPSFMNPVKSITKVNNNVWHWIVDGPMGAKLEWDAEMDGVEAEHRISWHTISDSAVKASGEVQFREISSDSTQVTSRLEYQAPMGAVGEMVAKLFSNPDAMVKEDLQNFKKLVEAKSPSSVI